MRRTQKTLSLNDELCIVTQAYADYFGTSFTRVLQAALLNFFFDELDRRDNTWSAIVSQLTSGSIGISIVPIVHLEMLVNDIQMAIHEANMDGDPETAQKMQDHIDHRITHELATWKKRIRAGGDGTASIEGLISSITRQGSIRSHVSGDRNADE